jgi:hypothetical protein
MALQPGPDRGRLVGADVVEDDVQLDARIGPLDPACGTGGMLSVAGDYLRELNPGARLEGYGQELNAETYAVCRPGRRPARVGSTRRMVAAAPID